MTESFESIIRDLLIHEKSSDRLATLFIRKIESDSPQHSEFVAYLNFLVHAGYKKNAIEILSHYFQGHRPIPLMTFCFLLHKSGFKPGQEFIKHLISAQKEQKPADQLKYFSAWEAHSFFYELREQTIKQYQDEIAEKKKHYLDKLEYLRSSRMIDEEEKLLNEILELYPDVEPFKSMKQEFAQRWAREILARKNRPPDVTEEAEENAANKITATSIAIAHPELKLTLGAIMAEMLNRVKQHPALAYDFAICFYFLEQYDLALNIIKYAPISVPADWLTLELLLKSHRYIECLDALATIETRYANDPETTFGTTYYRALALNHLGQKNIALQLLKSIVHIRPTYRSAHSLLLKWGGTL